MDSNVPTLINTPKRIPCVGNKPKIIDEFVGGANTGEKRLSVAKMISPGGWTEPGQTPEFDEFSLVLAGVLRVEHKGGFIDVKQGQAIVCHAGEWIKYSTPEMGGAEYVAICLPAFSPDTVHRDS